MPYSRKQSERIVRGKKAPRDLHAAGGSDVFMPASTEGLARAKVIANFGIESAVILDGEERRIGNMLRRATVAGDWVWTDGRTVLGIEPRGKVLARFVEQSGVKLLGAHLDQVGVVCSASLPPFHPDFVERYIIYCRIVGLPFFIVLNKMDEQRKEVLELVEPFDIAGIEIIRVSALTGEGMDVLKARLAGRSTILSGLSGVGKSTLINALLPEAEIPTQEIGEKTRRGRHTTTTSRAWSLGDGWLLDSPGIRRFGFIGIARHELKKGFPEFDPFEPKCHFANCLHVEEDGCAVREAIEEELIDDERYLQYLDFLDMLE